MTILAVFGTRPECIKLAPVIKELEHRGIPNKVCITAFKEFFRDNSHAGEKISVPIR